MARHATLPDVKRQPIRIAIGGEDDPFRDFPSTTSARARKHFEQTGKPLELLTMGHLSLIHI